MEYALLPSGLEHSVPDSEHSSAMDTEMSQSELPCADAAHQLDASDRGRSIAELLEAEHYGDALIDGSVVLLNEVVEVFRRVQLRVGRQKTVDAWKKLASQPWTIMSVGLRDWVYGF